MKFITDLNPSEEEMTFLEDKLFEYNGTKIDGYAYENIIIKSVDDDNTLIAGIHCQIGGNWLYIASLWVEETYRGQGIGKQLLIQAESLAAQKKCQGMYLYTYSFQNPEFYKKLGYTVFGTLENYCKNHAKYYMKKNFK